jgi:hypothetical protein
MTPGDKMSVDKMTKCRFKMPAKHYTFFRHKILSQEFYHCAAIHYMLVMLNYTGPWAQCYEFFYGSYLRIFIIS